MSIDENVKKIRTELAKERPEIATHIELQDINDNTAEIAENIDELSQKTAETTKELADKIEQNGAKTADSLDKLAQVLTPKEPKQEILNRFGLFFEALRGEDGKDGYTPIKGVDYFDGKNGERGADGKNADEAKIIKEVSAKIRVPKDGRDGKDGSPDTPEQIKVKLETLKGKQRLDISAIKGFPTVEDFVKQVKEKKLLSASNLKDYESLIFNGKDQRWGGHGGVNKLVAGTGISLSPTGGMGEVTITATAAGTPKWADLLGDIDGLNVTFTVSGGDSPIADSETIYLDRQPQMPTLDYTIAGNTITYVQAPLAALSGQPHKIHYTV